SGSSPHFVPAGENTSTLPPSCGSAGDSATHTLPATSTARPAGTCVVAATPPAAPGPTKVPCGALGAPATVPSARTSYDQISVPVGAPIETKRRRLPESAMPLNLVPLVVVAIGAAGPPLAGMR